MSAANPPNVTARVGPGCLPSSGIVARPVAGESSGGRCTPVPVSVSVPVPVSVPVSVPVPG